MARVNPCRYFAHGADRTISPWITPTPRRANMRRRTGKIRTRTSRCNVAVFEEEFKMPKAVTEVLTELHHLTFFSGASVPPFDWGHWWLAYREATPVAFAGVVPSTHVRNAGYFCRVGVLRRHWGHRLQLRLMRTMEARARRNGWSSLVSDTTGNVVSANNFIRAGYRMYRPPCPWAFPDTIYWHKAIALGASSHSTHSKRR